MEHAQAMQKWLKCSYGITVAFEWLTACLEWIEQDNKPSTQTVKGLQCQIFEQWLMSDLSEIGEKSLPTDLASFHSTELTDIYPLQLVSCFEVGSSLYSQLQKSESKKLDSDELDDKKPWMPKPTRMLLLCLTDGHTQVKAVEYQPIQPLNALLPYGLKMLLRGPLRCRKGVILLTSGSIQVLGGEVEITDEDNKPSEILKKTMVKNREHGDGYARAEFSGTFLVQNKDFKSDKVIKKEKAMSNFSNTGSLYQKQEIGSSKDKSLIIKSEITTSNIELNESKQKIWPIKATPRNEDEWEDDIDYSHLLEDEMSFNENEDMKEEIDFRHEVQTSMGGINMYSESVHFNESKGFSNLFKSKLKVLQNTEQITSAKDSLKRPHGIKETLASSQAKRTITQPSLAAATAVAILPETSQASSSNVFNNLSQNNNMNKCLPQAVIQPIDHQLLHCEDVDDELPYQYLSNIKKLKLPAKITIKAYISTLTEKLGSNNGLCWSLACRINDGTASIDVLATMIGFTAKASFEMRQKMKTQPQIKQVLMQGLSQCQQKLINISCLMELEITSLSRKPVVKKLLEISSDHVNRLLERLATHIPPY